MMEGDIHRPIRHRLVRLFSTRLCLIALLCIVALLQLVVLRHLDRKLTNRVVESCLLLPVVLVLRPARPRTLSVQQLVVLLRNARPEHEVGEDAADRLDLLLVGVPIAEVVGRR